MFFCFVLFGIWLSHRSHCSVCACAQATNNHPLHSFAKNQAAPDLSHFPKSEPEAVCWGERLLLCRSSALPPSFYLSIDEKCHPLFLTTVPSAREDEGITVSSHRLWRRFSPTWLLLFVSSGIQIVYLFLFLNEAPLATVATVNICASVSPFGWKWWRLPSLAHGLTSAQIFPLCLIFRAAGLLSAIPAALKPITPLLIPLLQDTIPMMVIKILSMLTGKLYFSHNSTLMAK